MGFLLEQAGVVVDGTCHVHQLSFCACCQNGLKDRVSRGTLSKIIPRLHSSKLTKLAGKWTLNEDVFPIENGDIPSSYVIVYHEGI